MTPSKIRRAWACGKARTNRTGATFSDADKDTPEEVINVAKIIHENDPNHPIWLVQAPRGSVDRMKRYVPGWDVGGIDIYAISYPPGVHTELENKDLSMVGDWTRTMTEVAGKKPFWMTLQIAFSGVVKPEKTSLPHLSGAHFMAYEAIINGAARALLFRWRTSTDAQRSRQAVWLQLDVLRQGDAPLFDEIGPKSPILPALLAPDSNIKLTVKLENPPKRAVQTKAEEVNKNDASPKQFVQDTVEGHRRSDRIARPRGRQRRVRFGVRKEGPTIRVRFSGLSGDFTNVTNTNMLENKQTKADAVHPGGTVMFEEPRTVEVKDGSFTDWFGPHEVHVYKFSK